MIFYRPGDEIQSFSVHTKATSTGGHGRVKEIPGEIPVGTFSGALTSASQKEMDQWKQNGHPITHTIVVYGATIADAGDVVSFGERKFNVQGKSDPGELGIRQVLYCEERPGG